MTDKGVVYDLGYVPYEGERQARRGAISTTYRDGIFRVFGIRRRARKKILPWILVVLALLPAIVFVGFAFLLSTFSPEAESPFGSYADYFSLTGGVVLLFVALAAPELLIPDRRQGVLSIYSSRPLRPDDYVGARAASLLTVVAGFMLIPQVLMYIGFAALSSEGLVGALVSDFTEIPKILLAAAAYAVAYSPPAILVSTFTMRKATASGLFLGVFFMAPIFANFLTQSTGTPGSRFFALLDVTGYPSLVRDWVFGDSTSSSLVVARAGFDPWMALLLIAVIAALCSAIVVWRYRRLM